jgi:hypothetical protein
VLLGCAREPLAAEAGCEEVLPGDIVITEIHANPDGSDRDSEYIELFNASGRALELQGLALVSSREDGTKASEHQLGEALVEAERYFVLGSTAADSLPAHVDYSYHNDLGSLRNSDAALLVRCGETVIDSVRYASTRDGHALQLDGRLFPDDASNDDGVHWCFASETAFEFSPGNFGTPGAPNSPCEETTIEGTCLDGETRRPIDAPAPGEVDITEWMASPDGLDDELEWVEVRFNRAADLNGLRLGSQDGSLGNPIVDDTCLPVDAGAWVVFGASPAAAPRVDAELDVSLGNSDKRSIVLAVEDTVLDRVDYVGSKEGVAWQIDPAGALCLVDAIADYEYRDANFGTPGVPNPSCAPVLEAGTCLDGEALRPIRSPSVEQVEITEWMANPSMVGNRQGEWVEVRFAAAVDLNGLVWADLAGASAVLERDECLSVPAGAFAVFARNANADENGGLPFVDAELGVSLNNTDEALSISIDGEVLDSISYERSKPGVATQVDEFGVICDAMAPYGDGDLGTPGAPNRLCP